MDLYIGNEYKSKHALWHHWKYGYNLNNEETINMITKK